MCGTCGKQKCCCPEKRVSVKGPRGLQGVRGPKGDPGTPAPPVCSDGGFLKGCFVVQVEDGEIKNQLFTFPNDVSTSCTFHAAGTNVPKTLGFASTINGTRTVGGIQSIANTPVSNDFGTADVTLTFPANNSLNIEVKGESGQTIDFLITYENNK